MENQILGKLAEAVKTYDVNGARELSAKAMTEGVEPLKALDALTAAIRGVGDAFGEGEIFLPELVSAADAMQAALPTIEERLQQTGGQRASVGKVVAGTVAGDIHNIGKSMLCTLLTADGFEVIDLGIDVPTPQFVEAVKEHEPDIVALSALLTITAMEQRNVIDALKEAGIRDTVQVIVGGGAINDDFADSIGADGYDPTAPGGVALCRKLLGK
ncbi:MAG: corrinoid protein [Anaerolineae bacterium]|jgi:corrinoid protein of di/trimethylamine methyltransferase